MSLNENAQFKNILYDKYIEIDTEVITSKIISNAEIQNRKPWQNCVPVHCFNLFSFSMLWIAYEYVQIFSSVHFRLEFKRKYKMHSYQTVLCKLKSMCEYRASGHYNVIITSQKLSHNKEINKIRIEFAIFECAFWNVKIEIFVLPIIRLIQWYFNLK